MYHLGDTAGVLITVDNDIDDSAVFLVHTVTYLQNCSWKEYNGRPNDVYTSLNMVTNLQCSAIETNSCHDVACKTLDGHLPANL